MTNEEVMTLMFDMGIHDSLDKEDWIPDNAWFWFANKVAEREREECAKLAELVAREMDNTNNTASYIASGIRARGEK